MDPWWSWKKAFTGRVDQAYREAYLREDVNQARIVMTVVAFMVLAYIYADYLELGFVPPFFLFATLRVIFFFTTIGLTFHFTKTKDIKFIDVSILTWNLTIVGLGFSSSVCRSAISVENVTVNHLWIVSFYLLIPNRHLFKVLPAMAVSLVSFYILSNYEHFLIQGSVNLSLFTKISTVIAINFVSFIIALRFDAQRYHQYLIQKTLIDGRALLKELANTDSLTGILNRRSFLEIAEIEFDRFKRYGNQFSFAIIDLDKLKSINDTHGHPTGDLALQQLITTIQGEKRSSDTIGRLAGDEFGLLLPETTAEKALEMLARMKTLFINTPIETPHGTRVHVSFSAGVTEARDSDETFDNLYRRADRSLYSAKRKGRNQIARG